MPPAVSVILPTHSRLEFLRRAIESVLAQTFEDLEVVVVDDGPNDAIAEFVAGHPDKCVRLVRHERNQGVAAARNTGIAAATGSYIGFIDDDDLWLPTKLERQVPLLRNEGADVVHSLVYIANGEGEVYEAATQRGFRLFREVAAAGYPYLWLLRRSSFQIGTFLVRRTCINDIGGFDATLSAVDDLDFVHRLRRRYEFRLVDEPLTKYCFHETNWSHDKDPQSWVRLAHKELAWLREADPPGRSGIEAYLQMQIAQAAWIGGRYRSAVRPALRARRLDPSVISGRTLAKYSGAALAPKSLIDSARQRVRSARPAVEPDPWIDLEP
jgi:glycosyltransferase involved in cell wall biosynthesis